MALLRPFRALRPTNDKASQVAAPPYDIVNREEATKLASEALNFLHVSRAEIDLPSSIPPHSEEVYQQARRNFERLVHAGPMRRDPELRLYVYRLRRGVHVQTGIGATFSIDEYNQEIIRKHERTRPDKEDDRTRHLIAVGAQTGPVFLAYRGLPEIQEEVAKITAQEPLYDFTAPDGVVHTLWSTTESARLVELFRQVPSLYIADGHHRAASASRARAHFQHHLSSEGSEAGDWDFFLAVAFPAEELRILPYHRIVRNLIGFIPAHFLQALNQAFFIEMVKTPKPRAGEFGLYLTGKWYHLRPKSAPNPEQKLESLDVSILQNQILAPLLGIEDPRSDSRLDFVGGSRGISELERLVNHGHAQMAFALHPTAIPQLLEISDSGRIMPPKSTWFEPKLRDGLLIYPLERPLP